MSLIESIQWLRSANTPDNHRRLAGGGLCAFALLSVLLLTGAFSPPPPATGTPAETAENSLTRVVPPPGVPPAPEYHGIPVLSPEDAADAGGLRVLAVRDAGQPMAPAVALEEIRLLKGYAAETGQSLSWVLVDKPWNLLPALQAGRGDLIAGQDEGLLAGMVGQAEFSLSWTTTRQRVVGRRGSRPLTGLEDLHDRQIAVQSGSPAEEMLTAYAAQHPAMDVVRIPPDQDIATTLHRVKLGQYDLAVVDSESLAEHLARHPELNILFDLPGGEHLAWAVHPEQDDLRKGLNRFLSREALVRSVADIRFEDLPRIAERRTLRVITYHSPANYYIDEDGELRGFEYELVRKFARRRDLRVEMIVAPTQEHMVRWLLEGRGDLIAASIPKPGIRKDPRLSISRPYNYAAPLIVGRDGEETLIDARDLEGRRIVLPAGSAHKRLLQRYQQRGIAVEIVEADPEQSIADILHRVAVGIYDLTVVDSHKARVLLAAEAGTRAHFPISEPLPHGWIVRADDNQLLEAVNRFIADTYRKRDYNILHARYFEHPVKRMTPRLAQDQELLALGGELSPYDDLVRRYAEKFGFDWRLIVAQMYQESRFDPEARSSAGALGLMQLLPTTAEEVGVADPFQPASSISGGIRYLNHLYGRFEDDLAFEDRMWFSLAAYNAGFQRVVEARRRAAEMDLDPDRWFDNVERAMLAMADNTPCRCGQPVVYVREIRARYHNYVRLTRAAQYAARDHRTLRQDT